MYKYNIITLYIVFSFLNFTNGYVGLAPGIRQHFGPGLTDEQIFQNMRDNAVVSAVLLPKFSFENDESISKKLEKLDQNREQVPLSIEIQYHMDKLEELFKKDDELAKKSEDLLKKLKEQIGT